jgi:hypothetical protein
MATSAGLTNQCKNFWYNIFCCCCNPTSYVQLENENQMYECRVDRCRLRFNTEEELVEHIAFDHTSSPTEHKNNQHDTERILQQSEKDAHSRKPKVDVEIMTCKYISVYGTSPIIKWLDITAEAIKFQCDLGTCKEFNVSCSKCIDTTNNVKKQSICVICQEKFMNDDKLRVLMCRHIFHVNCIDPYAKKTADELFSCPMCRSK